MKIINDGLPEPLYQAICNDDYDPGRSDFTPSSLNQPPQQRRLMREHGDKLEEKASNRIWALQGSSIHYMIDRVPNSQNQYIKEHRFYREILVDGIRYSISSKIDLVDTHKNIIYDFKYTSIYTSQHGPKPEWIAQLNIGNWVLCTGNWVLNGGAKKLVSVPIYRDRSEKKGDPALDQFEVEIWGEEKTEQWIADRIRAHKNKESVCTPEEMWERPEKWAVMKKGRKSAVKLYDTKVDAEEGTKIVSKGIDLSKVHYVEHRPGVRPRCERYCPVNKFCKQYQEYEENKK